MEESKLVQDVKLDEEVAHFERKVLDYFTMGGSSELHIPSEVFRKMNQVGLARSTELLEELCRILVENSYSKKRVNSNGTSISLQLSGNEKIKEIVYRVYNGRRYEPELSKQMK